jgi:hypothetical protein
MTEQYEEAMKAAKAYMSQLGKRSAASMTPEQRKERARKAGQAKGKKK